MILRKSKYKEGDQNVNFPQDEGRKKSVKSRNIGDLVASSQSVEFVAGQDVNPMDREGVLLQDYFDVSSSASRGK